MKNQIAQAKEYLLQDRNHHINMLSALQANLAEVVSASEKGCLFRTGGDIWQMAAADEETALHFYDMIPEDATMLEVQDMEWTEPLRKKFHPTCVETYYNVWYARSRIELPDVGAQVRTLQQKDAGEVASYYHLPGPSCGIYEATKAYVAERIETGTMYGAYLDGKLAGFVGTHGEGSLGCLTVVPEFRRKGLGTFLELTAISKALERGDIPFGQVAEHNEASLSLQRSLGLTIADKLVCWMEKG